MVLVVLVVRECGVSGVVSVAIVAGVVSSLEV